MEIDINTPIDEIIAEYYRLFGEFYGVNWCYEIEDFVDDMLYCIETGNKQNVDDLKYPWNNGEKAPDDAVL